MLAVSVAVVDEAKHGMPGELSVWRARWLLLRYGGALLVPPDGVEATGQLDLLALVDEVAERVGVTRPDTVLLTGTATVRGWANRSRRMLVIGLPLLQCLPVDEIRALVAHELAVVDHRRPHLVARLRELHKAAVEPLLHDAPLSRKSRAVLRVTEGFASALEQRADQAATSASGLHTAARAVVKADLAEFEFVDLVFDLEEQVWKHAKAGVQDLHTGWQAAVDAGAISVDLDADTRATLMSRHPFLAGAIAPLRVEHVRLRQPTARVSLRPLDAKTQRTLSQHALTRDCRKWTTFAQVPVESWPSWMVRQAKEITDQVGLLLGREPANPAEVVSVLVTRLAELVAANWPNQPVDPDQLDASVSVVVVAEAELTRRGWHRVHPAAAGVLVGPDGVQHNLHELARRAVTDNEALTTLMDLLES
jgi:hypothetical protein